MEGETVEVLVEQAKEAGKIGAEVEQLEEQVEQLQGEVESNKQIQQWNDESISRAFDRLWALEERVSALEETKIQQEVVEEVVENVAEETTEETTVIEDAQQTARKRGAKATWGLF